MHNTHIYFGQTVCITIMKGIINSMTQFTESMKRKTPPVQKYMCDKFMSRWELYLSKKNKKLNVSAAFKVVEENLNLDRSGNPISPIAAVFYIKHTSLPNEHLNNPQEHLRKVLLPSE